MADAGDQGTRQSTARREWITYVVEDPIVAPTARLVRIESGADALRKRPLSVRKIARDTGKRKTLGVSESETH